MVGEIQDPNLHASLYKKHKHDYILYITQFEINTSNKNQNILYFSDISSPSGKII